MARPEGFVATVAPPTGCLLPSKNRKAIGTPGTNWPWDVRTSTIAMPNVVARGAISIVVAGADAVAVGAGTTRDGVPTRWEVDGWAASLPAAAPPVFGAAAAFVIPCFEGWDVDATACG